MDQKNNIPKQRALNIALSEPLIYHHQSGFGSDRHGFDRAYPEAFQLPNSDSWVTLPPVQPMGDFEQRPYSPAVLPTHGNGDPIVYCDRGSGDVLMAAPAPQSRRTSEMTGVQPTSVVESIDQVCTCDKKTDLGPNVLLPNLARDALGIVHQPYARVAIDGLLNCDSSPHTLPAHSQVHNNTQAYQPSIPSAIPDPHICHSTLSPTLSTTTTTSSNTLRADLHAPFPAVEQRCFLLSTLYHICVDATFVYSRSLFHTRHSRRRYRRYYPYRSSYPNRSSGNRAVGNASGSGARPSLMDNISTICTHLWRKARHDAIAPHRAEADAVREMRDLYAWAELVARAMDSDGLLSIDGISVDSESVSEYGTSGGGGAAAAESSGEMEVPIRVGRAAKRICEWVGDEEAWDSCQSVCDELRQLDDMGRGGDKRMERDRRGRVLEEVEDGEIL